MGTNAANSVVNGFGQTQPGIFPTCGASNPTYTVFALSLRTAENLVSNCDAITQWGDRPDGVGRSLQAKIG
jgi:hypothetical protein